MTINTISIWELNYKLLDSDSVILSIKIIYNIWILKIGSYSSKLEATEKIRYILMV